MYAKQNTLSNIAAPEIIPQSKPTTPLVLIKNDKLKKPKHNTLDGIRISYHNAEIIQQNAESIIHHTNLEDLTSQLAWTSGHAPLVFEKILNITFTVSLHVLCGFGLGTVIGTLFAI